MVWLENMLMIKMGKCMLLLMMFLWFIVDGVKEMCYYEKIDGSKY